MDLCETKSSSLAACHRAEAHQPVLRRQRSEGHPSDVTCYPRRPPLICASKASYAKLAFWISPEQDCGEARRGQSVRFFDSRIEQERVPRHPPVQRFCTKEDRRPDIVLFVNGSRLVVIGKKSPTLGRGLAPEAIGTSPTAPAELDEKWLPRGRPPFSWRASPDVIATLRPKKLLCTA
jgi:hypothetical protein